MSTIGKKTAGVAVVISLSLLGATGRGDAPRERTFLFTYRAVITDIPAGAKEVKVWLPYPAGDAHQRISRFTVVEAPTKATITKEKEYGNSILCLSLPNPTATSFPITLQYQVHRKESVNEGLVRAASVPGVILTKVSPRFLKPDRLVPIDGDIKALSDRVTANKPDRLSRVRAIYDHVRQNMVYDKSGNGWGRGDTRYACQVGRGNCTDFHALFISLTRAQGIPAKFEIGFPLPEKRGEGIVTGYHCWAQFYLEGYGWIPVDASEAGRHPEKAEYYFGAIDENRVLFTVGRDITLSPRQEGDPLNYFVYPYVEIDGNPFTHVGHEFRYKDVP